ncbi:MAG: hypothetical protein EOO68_10230 [Moraxellaceae bacterium]|nr:MAG: hypothetical protein EOO68_10230 [Moraxellaceae bacterium]
MNRLKFMVRRVPRVFLIAGLIYVALLIVYWLDLGWPADSSSQWGEFGDFIGGVLNPTFGLLTIWLLAETLRHSEDSHTVEMVSSRAEKDLVTALNLCSVYENQVADLKARYEGVGQSSETDREIAEAYRQAMLGYKLKHDVLVGALDHQCDSLISRLYTATDLQPDLVSVYRGMKIQVYYVFHAEFVLIKVLNGAETKVLYLRPTVEVDSPQIRRKQAIEQARLHAELWIYNETLVQH